MFKKLFLPVGILLAVIWSSGGWFVLQRIYRNSGDDRRYFSGQWYAGEIQRIEV